MAEPTPKNDAEVSSEEVHSKPIPGPPPGGPEYAGVVDYDRPLSAVARIGRFMADCVRSPAYWVRENIVEPNRGPKYYWYHRKFARALPIDECYMDDFACIYEANIEFRRVLMVDRETLNILQRRRDFCWWWHQTKQGRQFPAEECQDIIDTYKREEINFFIKYGDMAYNSSVEQAYMKQKNRMIMERRIAEKKAQGHGPEERPAS